VSGSAARAGQADSIGLVIPNKEDGVIQSTTVYWPKVRDGDDPVLPVTFRTNAKARSIELVDRPTKSRGVDAETLCAFVAAFPMRSGSWLAKQMSKSKESVLAALQSLETDGKVRREGDARTGGYIIVRQASSDVPF
jgi:hypothetical protein